MGTPIKWEDANFSFSNNLFTWEEVELVREVISGAIEDQVWNQFDTDKKKRLVKLICKVQGKTIKEEKQMQNYKIKVSDIKLLAEKVLGIEVLTENVKF